MHRYRFGDGIVSPSRRRFVQGVAGGALALSAAKHLAWASKGQQDAVLSGTEFDLMKGAVGPFGDYISMGGMFTIVKVRDRLASYDQDPGWYQHPPGTVGLKASAEDLARDGIDVNAPTPKAVTSASNAPIPRPARVDPMPPAMKAHHAQ